LLPRSPRVEIPGGVFHVYARGSRQQAIYRTRSDRLTYLGFLSRTIDRYRWDCLAYCLMGNHVHLLVETPEANLGKGMQSLHGRYAQRINQRYGTKGALFESRYGCVVVENDVQLWMVIRYIALNPVEAGLCVRAEDYEWSSYGPVLASLPPRFLNSPRLLSYLSASGGNPLENYRNLVAADF
jgi:REP element-mobilizing transposase RayT